MCTTAGFLFMAEAHFRADRALHVAPSLCLEKLLVTDRQWLGVQPLDRSPPASEINLTFLSTILASLLTSEW